MRWWMLHYHHTLQDGAVLYWLESALCCTTKSFTRDHYKPLKPSKQWFRSNPVANSGKTLCCVVSTEDLLPSGFPNIDMGPQLKVVERTRTATMLCAASGNPDPEITWYKDFLPIDPSASNGRIKQLRSGKQSPKSMLFPFFDPVVWFSAGLFFSVISNVFVQLFNFEFRRFIMKPLVNCLFPCLRLAEELGRVRGQGSLEAVQGGRLAQLKGWVVGGELSWKGMWLKWHIFMSVVNEVTVFLWLTTTPKCVIIRQWEQGPPLYGTTGGGACCPAPIDQTPLRGPAKQSLII